MPSISKLWPVSGTTAIQGAVGLTDPTRVSADDGSYATGDATQNPGERYGNWALNGSIPSGATIDSVIVEYQYKWSSFSAGGGSKTASVRGRVGGVLLTAHSDSSGTGSDRVVTATLTGDRAWTRADLLDGTFEVVLSAATTGGLVGTVNFDYLKVTVGYTVAAPQSVSLGKVASSFTLRGLFFGALNLGQIASPAVVYGVQLTQEGDVQYLPVGKVAAGLSGDLGASWTSPAFGYITGLAITQNRLTSASGTVEGVGAYTAAQLAADWAARFTITAVPGTGGRVRLFACSSTAGTDGYVMTVNANGLVTVDEIGGGTVLTYTVASLSVGDDVGLSKIGSYFTLFYRPVTGVWDRPASGTSSLYDGPVYVGLSVWQDASVDDLYVDGLL